MKKKIITCSMVLVLIMLVASTALADDGDDHPWNGHCIHSFTTDASVNYTSSDEDWGIPVRVIQNQCYMEINCVSTRSQIWLVNDSGSPRSSKVMYPLEEAGADYMYPTDTGNLHCRIYNYDHYGDLYIRSIGLFYEW